jgi:hypothetical protein
VKTGQQHDEKSIDSAKCARSAGHFEWNDLHGVAQWGARGFMKCSNGHYTYPQFFASSERRKAEKGKNALCMTCLKNAHEKAASLRNVGKKENAKRGSAWRNGGHDRILLAGTKF